MDRRRIGTAVLDRDADDEVLGRRLGVLHGHVEVPVVVEDAGVQELELPSPSLPAAVLLDELLVGIGALRVLVEPLHVGVGGRGVEIEVVLLDVLAVVSLGRRQTEERAPSGSGPARSRGRARRPGSGSGRRSRPGRPRPSGRPCCGPDRAAGSPRHCRPRCSPHGPCPRSARPRTDPSDARPRGRRPGRRGVRAPSTRVEAHCSSCSVSVVMVCGALSSANRR